jgi:hypothetical protein
MCRRSKTNHSNLKLSPAHFRHFVGGLPDHTDGLVKAFVQVKLHIAQHIREILVVWPAHKHGPAVSFGLWALGPKPEGNAAKEYAPRIHDLGGWRVDDGNCYSPGRCKLQLDRRPLRVHLQPAAESERNGLEARSGLERRRRSEQRGGVHSAWPYHSPFKSSTTTPCAGAGPLVPHLFERVRTRPAVCDYTTEREGRTGCSRRMMTKK